MSNQLEKPRQHIRAFPTAQVGGWALPVAAVATLVTVSLVAWLRSRQTQSTIDAQTARRLSSQSGPADRPAVSASDMVIGEPVDAHSSS